MSELRDNKGSKGFRPNVEDQKMPIIVASRRPTCWRTWAPLHFFPREDDLWISGLANPYRTLSVSVVSVSPVMGMPAFPQKAFPSLVRFRRRKMGNGRLLVRLQGSSGHRVAVPLKPVQGMTQTVPFTLTVLRATPRPDIRINFGRISWDMSHLSGRRRESRNQKNRKEKSSKIWHFFLGMFFPLLRTCLLADEQFFEGCVCACLHRSCEQTLSAGHYHKG